MSLGIKRVDRIASQLVDEPDDLFIAAASFEPRCVRAAQMLGDGDVRFFVMFRYDDTLDIIQGAENGRILLAEGRRAACDGSFALDCSFRDPFSVTRVFRAWCATVASGDHIGSITVDISCLTKIHLLLLLDSLREVFAGALLRIVYTEPLAYAIDYDKTLSYGVEETVYLPLTAGCQRSGASCLMLFLGHEMERCSRIIDDLEPDLVVLMPGVPGHSPLLEKTSRDLQEKITVRAMYDEQYRILPVPTRDYFRVAQLVSSLVGSLSSVGFESFFVAPMGTKLESLAIDFLRHWRASVRLLLAYAIPRRYERRHYSQGFGHTWSAPLWPMRRQSEFELFLVSNIYYANAFDLPAGAEAHADRQTQERLRKAAILELSGDIGSKFCDLSVDGLVLADGKVAAEVRSTGNSAEISQRLIERSSGKISYFIQRAEYESTRLRAL